MKIHYVSGSRADFGLMLKALRVIDAAPEHDLALVITGQHTVEKYGATREELIGSGLGIAGEVPVELSGRDGAEMAFALAAELQGLAKLWQARRPELVLLLGDRGEMLAAALAAVHLGIHVAHIHGGELSGTLDESFRHAVSKLAHFHFTATSEARDRLIKMGERPEQIRVIGAPGLVGLGHIEKADQATVAREFGFPRGAGLALTVFHPVVQEATDAARQVEAMVEGVAACGMAQVILRSNSDAGGAAIDRYLDGLSSRELIRVVTHLERDRYEQLLASADVLVGNSSSGIIESASFGTPCVNIGSRQNGRQRNCNTIDCPEFDMQRIVAAITQALSLPRVAHNVYGDGNAHLNLLEALNTIQLLPSLLLKQNSY